MYPTFDFLRPPIPENDKKFDFLPVTLIGEIVEEEWKINISNQHGRKVIFLGIFRHEIS